jgi:hypothetical protein
VQLAIAAVEKAYISFLSASDEQPQPQQIQSSATYGIDPAFQYRLPKQGAFCSFDAGSVQAPELAAHVASGGVFALAEQVGFTASVEDEAVFGRSKSARSRTWLDFVRGGQGGLPELRQHGSGRGRIFFYLLVWGIKHANQPE